MGETFKWVTNPDIGLTAHLTPVGEPCDLYVVEKSTRRSSYAAVTGSELYFRLPRVRPANWLRGVEHRAGEGKESYIPSMADHRQLYERRPDLKSYNSLERFKGMQHAINPKAELDLSRAQALRDAIIEFDPAVHELPRPPRPEEMTVEDAHCGK